MPANWLPAKGSSDAIRNSVCARGSGEIFMEPLTTTRTLNVLQASHLSAVINLIKVRKEVLILFETLFAFFALSALSDGSVSEASAESQHYTGEPD